MKRASINHERFPPHLPHSVTTLTSTLHNQSCWQRCKTNNVRTVAVCTGLFSSVLSVPSTPSPQSATQAVTSTVHLKSGDTVHVREKRSPPVFEVKMRARGSSEHVGSFLNVYEPHTKELCCSKYYQFALELLVQWNPTNTAVRLVVYTTGSGTSARTSRVTLFT
jgi:hypothetical protein